MRNSELGVNAFVVKPMDFRGFFEAIHDVSVFWAVLNEILSRAARLAGTS